MSASNGYTGDVEGTVEVCFDNPIASYLDPSVDTATMEMEVEGLPATIAGGVHIHKGTSCDGTSTQLGHYWNPALDAIDSAFLGPAGNGDPWLVHASKFPCTNWNWVHY